MLAFSLRRPSRLRYSGRAHVEYVAHMKVADSLWTFTNSPLTSTNSQRTSTDSQLTLYQLLLTSTDSLLISTDSQLTLYQLLLKFDFYISHFIFHILLLICIIKIT